MSVTKRQMLSGMLYSVGLSALLILFFLYVFPVDSIKDLWEEQIMDIPFILFIPAAGLCIGAVAGGLNGYLWQKQLDDISLAISDMESGKQPETKTDKRNGELKDVYKMMDKLRTHVTEQTAISQKLANERAEEQDKRIQKIVSEERNRLARELHDSVSQQLFAASMLMSAINEGEQEEETRQKQLKLAENMIHQSQLEMRALLLHLRPVPLKGKTLNEGIEELLLELQNKVPMDIDWHLEPAVIDKGVEDQLFRIFQESVSNTLRHSKASLLEVRLFKRENRIIMIVSDDGQGFDPNHTKTGSYGLQNMHERALEVGGTLKIVSVPKKGTRLEVKIPLIEKGEKND